MYPKRKDLFVAWSKAMVEGSTVDKPNYPGTRARRARATGNRRKRIHMNRRKRKSSRNG